MAKHVSEFSQEKTNNIKRVGGQHTLPHTLAQGQWRLRRTVSCGVCILIRRKVRFCQQAKKKCSRWSNCSHHFVACACCKFVSWDLKFRLLLSQRYTSKYRGTLGSAICSCNFFSLFRRVFGIRHLQWQSVSVTNWTIVLKYVIGERKLFITT